MVLSEELKKQIMHMDCKTLLELMHECADQFVTVAEFKALTGTPKRTIYDKIKSKELESGEVFGTKIIYM